MGRGWTRCAKVQMRQSRVQKCKGGRLRCGMMGGPPQGGQGQGRGYAAPSVTGGHDKSCPYQCSPCGELGQHVVLSLPAGSESPPYLKWQLGRDAVPTLPVSGGSG